MTGDVLYRPPVRNVHECHPPLRCAIWKTHPNEPPDDCWAPVFAGWQECTGEHNGSYCMAAEPAEDVGAIWRCGECGRLWTVYYKPDSYLNVFDGGNRWRRANWWERRRAKRIRPTTPGFYTT